MRGLVQGSDSEQHDQAVTEALEQFCSAPEQTYEQFLSTFTYLTPGDVRDPHLAVPRGHSDPSLREMDSSRQERRENRVTEIEENAFRRGGQANRCSPTADQEEVVLDGGSVAGRMGCSDRTGPDRPVKFDNYLEDSEDEEENTDNTGMCAVPGEVEEDLIPVSPSSLCHHTLLELSATFTHHGTHTHRAAENQNESDEVVPFHLDENFDYDNVVLSCKYPLQEENNGPS